MLYSFYIKKSEAGKMKATIFNIQKFSIHDGPGIRTVVFFKGCPLRCRWCSNPESQVIHTQILWEQERCIGCKTCESTCPAKSIRFVDNRFTFQHKTCTGCLECIRQCPAKAMEYTGKNMTIPEVMTAVKKDIDFYEESGGGVTLSGGEILIWHEFVTEVLKELKQEHIHSALETTGFAVESVFQKVAGQADLLLFDMKHYNDRKHQAYTGVSNSLIIKNMTWAAKKGIPTIARIPVIPDVNDSLKDAAAFSRRLTEIGIRQVHLLPFHQFGQKKYELLRSDYAMKDTKTLHPEDLIEYKQIFESAGFDVTL